MAPIVFEDINVFTFPHSRMKKLMNCCSSKVDHTDFTCSNDLEQLLIRLERTFLEFMAHEQIENEFVMNKLKKKLKQNCPTLYKNDLICNCHKDDRFTPLIHLFRDGYAFIRRGNADRMSYQMKLHKAIGQFYEDFLPHMNEEENDIQPLLLKYFTAMELKIMRIDVIKMTLQKRENSSINLNYPIERPLHIQVVSTAESKTINNLSNEMFEHIFEYLTDTQLKKSCLIVNKQWNQCVSKVLQDRSQICRLPNEILLRLFKYYLNPFELLSSCLSVNQKWQNLVKDATIWKSVNPINWAKGQWNTNFPLEQENLCENSFLQLKKNEIRIIDGFIKSFLPNYSCAIENLILYGSLTINDKTARKIFSFCPNLKYVNVGMTKLSSKAFLQYRWINSLESLIVEGCSAVDDNLFFNLYSSKMEFDKKCQLNSIEDKQKCLKRNCFSLNNQIDCEKCLPNFCFHSTEFQLKYLNLSGCYRLTDSGLNFFIENGLTTNLTFIDLSGCSQISSNSISLLLNVSTKLEIQSIYFCDNLQLSSSTFSTANSCRNVDNQSGLYCCRNVDNQSGLYCCRSTF